MQGSSITSTVIELFFIMINLLSGDSIIHPWLREKYTVRKKLQKSMIFLEDEIIRLCEHHRMHAV